MEKRIVLRPGVPDDDNRDYLPEECKNSDIVVNENGNNSQPYPLNLQECHGVLADGVEDVWYEYVPAGYDGTKEVPLVLSMHGGLMTGWGQAIYTSWTLEAERDGFILAFPNAHAGRVWSLQWGTWNADGKDPAGEGTSMPPEGYDDCKTDPSENHDIRMTLALIDHMKSKYRIDPGRIFMQGMSLGNLMTSMFARNYGNVLAGAAGAACSTFLSRLYDEDYHIRNAGGPLAVWQSRPECNNIPSDPELQKKVNKYNRLYWMRLNECSPIPEISIQGEDNLAFYHGKKADFVYLDIKNRDHGQSFNDAALVWDYLFSGIRRNEKGEIERIRPVSERKGDTFAAAFSVGASKAWVSGSAQEMGARSFLWKKLKYHGLNGGIKVRGEYIMAPLGMLAKIFGGNLVYGPDHLTAELSFDSGCRAGTRTVAASHLQFARGSIGCVIDNRICQMFCEAVLRDNELFVSSEWFAQRVFHMTVSTCDGVVYITDHFSVLSLYMADLIRDILMDRAVPDNFGEMLTSEKQDSGLAGSSKKNQVLSTDKEGGHHEL